MTLNNEQIWQEAKVAEWYAKDYSDVGLHENEKIILGHLREELLGKPILDLGCGGGRTTPSLLEISRDYVGVDYSSEMVRQCQARFPGVRFLCGDARALTMFHDAQFEFVLFSFNGIDYVPPKDRLTILREVSRVLKPGGRFLFSTHNIEKKITPAFSLKNLHWRKNPIGMARNFLRYLAGIRNYLGMRGLQTYTDEYALLVDSALNYRLLTCYIEKQQQVAHLRVAGFRTVEVFDRDAKVLDLTIPETQCAWLYYLTRKPVTSDQRAFTSSMPSCQ